MPKHGLTPEAEKWAQQMLKHFNLGEPVSGALPNETQLSSSRVRVSRNPLDHARRQAAEFLRDYEKIKARYASLSTRVKQTCAQTRKFLYSEDLKRSYEAVHSKLHNSLQKLDKNFRSFEASAEHLSFLKTWMDKAEYELTEMKKLQQQGRSYAEQQIKAEMAQVFAFQKTVEAAQSEYTSLCRATADLPRLEKILSSAEALLKQLLIAAKEYNLKAVQGLKRWLKGTAAALEKALEGARKETDTLKSHLQDNMSRLSSSLSDIKAALTNQDGSSDPQSDVLAQLATTEKELLVCKEAIQAGDLKAASDRISKCEELLFAAQQHWLQKVADEETELKQSQSTLKKIQILENDLTQAYQRSPMIHSCSPHGADFDNVCQTLRSELLQAQADLIAGRAQKAEESILALRKLRFQLYGWRLNAEENLQWVQKQQEQLAQEAKLFSEQLSSLKTYSTSNEAASAGFAAFDKELRAALADLDTSAAYIQKKQAVAARPLLQATGLRLRKLPGLAAMIELD